MMLTFKEALASGMLAPPFELPRMLHLPLPSFALQFL